MIEMERKSGILLLRRGSQSARLYCREGRVLAARLFTATAPTTLSGIDVVYKLLTWTDGRFDFSSVPVRLAGDGAKGRSAFVGGGASAAAATLPGAVDRELDIPITHLLWKAPVVAMKARASLLPILALSLAVAWPALVLPRRLRR